ncbi:MAG: hypothetical protein FD160_3952, partial [Caulobacteraceae bacterium]
MTGDLSTISSARVLPEPAHPRADHRGFQGGDATAIPARRTSRPRARSVSPPSRAPSAPCSPSRTWSRARTRRTSRRFLQITRPPFEHHFDEGRGRTATASASARAHSTPLPLPCFPLAHSRARELAQNASTSCDRRGDVSTAHCIPHCALGCRPTKFGCSAPAQPLSSMKSRFPHCAGVTRRRVTPKLNIGRLGARCSRLRAHPPSALGGTRNVSGRRSVSARAFARKQARGRARALSPAGPRQNLGPSSYGIPECPWCRAPSHLPSSPLGLLSRVRSRQPGPRRAEARRSAAPRQNLAAGYARNSLTSLLSRATPPSRRLIPRHRTG